MATTNVIFTKAQEALIQEMIDKVRRLPVAPPVGDEDKDDYQSPQVYIVKTPAGGIPPVTTAGTGSGTGWDTAAGDALGSAVCEVYYIDSSGVAQKVDAESAYSITVYNITEFYIRGDIFITAKREKYGNWIADRPANAIFRGKIASDCAPGSSMDFYIYEGQPGSEVATGRILPQVRNDTSCTIKANQIATVIEMTDNLSSIGVQGGWQFLIGKTA